jgi:hypothetical protein
MDEPLRRISKISAIVAEERSRLLGFIRRRLPDSADVELLQEVFSELVEANRLLMPIDPAKGLLVRRLFELYATGRYNLHSLKDEAQKSGLCNRRESKLSPFLLLLQRFEEERVFVQEKIQSLKSTWQDETAKRPSRRRGENSRSAGSALSCYHGGMAQLLVRHLEDDVKLKIQRRARRHGRSTEEEVREILRNAIKEEGSSQTVRGSLPALPDWISRRTFRSYAVSRPVQPISNRDRP